MSTEFYTSIVRLFVGESEFSLIRGKMNGLVWYEIGHFVGAQFYDCGRFSAEADAVAYLDVLTELSASAAMWAQAQPLHVKSVDLISGSRLERKGKTAWRFERNGAETP